MVNNARIEIVVEGIDDPTLASSVETALGDSLREMALSGVWRVAVTRSRVGGRWDFSVRGPGRRHQMSITVPPELLPDVIPRRLRESLHHAAARLVDRGGDRRPKRTSDLLRAI